VWLSVKETAVRSYPAVPATVGEPAPDR
jgi:hypothetical protein